MERDLNRDRVAELGHRVAALPLREVQRAFEAGLEADAPYHRREATHLEYRRWLLLRALRPDLEITASGPVASYARLHASRPTFAQDLRHVSAGTEPLDADALVRDGAGRPPIGPGRDLYDRLFPCGDIDLWGCPARARGPRRSAPHLSTAVRRLPDAMPDVTRLELREEATALLADAVEGHATDFGIERGCVSGGSGAFRYAEPGPRLWERHWSGDVAREVSAAVGTAVVPTGLSYNVHDGGAASPLHNDPYAAELALLTLLDGPAEPLHCHPDLADAPLEHLLELARRSDGRPDGGVPHDVGPVPLLLPGQSVPHHRRPASRSEPVVVAAEFFGVVVP